MKDSEMVMDVNLPLPRIYSGKVRETFDTSEYRPGTQLMVTTDRISVKDRRLGNGIPHKGEVLNGISSYLLQRLQGLGICPTHFITDSLDFGFFPEKLADVLDDYREILDGRLMLVRNATVLPWEFIPRSRLHGTAYDYYLEHGDVFGIPIPKNLKKGDLLPSTLFTLSTKAPEGQHDQNITYWDFLGVAGEGLAQRISGTCLNIYGWMQIFAQQRGIEYADTKIELGWVFFPGKGYILAVVDELGTPDSSRTIPDHLTKQPVRDYLKNIGFTGEEKEPVLLPDELVEITSKNYIGMYEQLTGRKIA